jgi:hypothetical protein
MGVVGSWRARAALSFTLRASASDETRTHRFGETTDRDDRQTVFGELSASDARGPNAFVAGMVAVRDQYSNEQVARFNTVRTTPAVFVQDTFSPTARVFGTANGRCDWSSAYGTICTPRLSLLARMGPGISGRLALGGGWFAPTPLTDETETFALASVRLPQPLRAERGRSASFDVTTNHGPLQVNGTLFSNRIANPVGLLLVAGDTAVMIDLVNASGPLETHGAEVFAVFNEEQYAAVSKPYATLGVLVSRGWSAVTLFVNAENLTNVRLSQFQPLLRTRPGEGGRWTVDPWAPLEGRRLNFGLRWHR